MCKKTATHLPLLLVNRLVVTTVFCSLAIFIRRRAYRLAIFIRPAHQQNIEKSYIVLPRLIAGDTVGCVPEKIELRAVFARSGGLLKLPSLRFFSTPQQSFDRFSFFVHGQGLLILPQSVQIEIVLIEILVEEMNRKIRARRRLSGEIPPPKALPPGTKGNRRRMGPA